MPNAIEIARCVPDTPRFVEVRAMLMEDGCDVFGSLEPGLVAVSRRTCLAGVIGKPAAESMREARRIMPPDVELLVPPESIEHARAVLPEWREHPATIHGLAEPIVPHDLNIDDVVLFERVDDEVRSRFVDQSLRKEVRFAVALAAKRVEGRFVSICYTNYRGETLWDAGVDTLPEHRRRGYARDCYLTLANHLASGGRQPVWGSLDTNEASMRMAASLGFVPIDRLSVFLPPIRETVMR